MADDQRRSRGSFDTERSTGSHEVIDRLFVYGTLRKGQTARSLIANQITKSSKASTTGFIYSFPMGYPGYTDPGDPNHLGRVMGEVLWLTELPATFGLLDAYEGADFARIIKLVTLETGESVWTWIYTLADPSTVAHGALIGDGDWVRYWREQQ
ncbi:MAG TPA: gamma-glutamylcyclotransferase family protein [Kofleriaceae bacterium]